MMEYVANKGPDDLGAFFHAGTPCEAQLGSASDVSYEMNGFTPDVDGSGSGTYKIHFVRDGREGFVYSHYDKATRKFDHDEVKENK